MESVFKPHHTQQFVPQESVVRAVEELITQGFPRDMAIARAIETQGHDAGDWVNPAQLTPCDLVMVEALYGLVVLQGRVKLERG